VILYADSGTINNPMLSLRPGMNVALPSDPARTVRVISVDRAADHLPMQRVLRYDGGQEAISRTGPIMKRAVVAKDRLVRIGSRMAFLSKVTPKTVMVLFQDGTEQRFTRKESDGRIIYMNGKDRIDFS
jgi:hypothetical protein